MPHFPDQTNALLGEISPNKFMNTYWQKKPYYIRQAIPSFQSPVTPQELFDYAQLDHVESRLVQKKPKGWSIQHGPFHRLPQLQQPGWSLLVQGVNAINAQIAALLDQFRFVPNIRLDDIMISYASNGGGVGPHFDSYDVFLLQAKGKRDWHIGPLANYDLLEDTPVKILKNFIPTETFTLEAGDMLYLPPRWGHDGIARTDDCMTISIGFRSPIAHELQIAALEFAAQELQIAGAAAILPEMYEDPHQPATDHPGKIPDTFIDYTHQLLQKIQWDRSFAARLLGSWFSEPKANIFFEVADDLPDLSLIEAPTRLSLHIASILLYTESHQFFMNGEIFHPLQHSVFYTLANQRVADIDRTMLSSLSECELATLQEWLEAGWIESEQPAG